MRADAAAFKPAITLSDALTDPALFGKTFGGSSFWTWRVVGKLIDGIPLTEARERQLFFECTGRSVLPTQPVKRLFLLCGRRAGKDRTQSAVAVWRSALCADWRKHMSAGEQAVVLLLGRDKRQAAILRKYCSGLLETPLLAREVVRRTDDVIEFRNGSSLEVASNDVALVRGRSAIAVLGSECCHWKTDERSASSDAEVVAASEPSLSMCVDGGLMVLGSSVYRKRGYMYQQYRKLHGNNDSEDICWFAPSATMNPKLPARVVEKALQDDPSRARAEYENVWREDIADFIPLDVVEACTEWSLRELPPQPGNCYFAYCDPAGGVGQDAFTVAIAHRLNDNVGTVVLDAVRERSPRFVPAEVVREYAALLKSYGISEIMSDSFAGGFHADEWVRNDIRFKPCDNSTSENYLHFLPMLLSGRARLLDHPKLRTQLVGLERRVSPGGGREIVSHAQIASAHDDIATAVAGAMVRAGDRTQFDNSWQWVSGSSDSDAEARDRWQRQRLQAYMRNIMPPWVAF